MNWIEAWTLAQRNLQSASKDYDALRAMPKPRRTALGLAEYGRRRRLAYKRFKTADENCLALRRLRDGSPEQIRRLVEGVSISP